MTRDAARPHPTRAPKAPSAKARSLRARPSRTRHPIRELGRAISWHRRKLAVLAAVIAVLAGVNAAAAPQPPHVTVITARATLRGGETVSASDLAAVSVPTTLAPDKAITQQERLVGQVLTGSVPRGQVLTDLDVVRPAAGPGQVLAPLRLSDNDIVGLLDPGDLIDVIAADPQGGGAKVLAERVRISSIAIPPNASVLGSSGAPQGGLLLVEVDRETARLLATASVSSSLSVTLQ